MLYFKLPLIACMQAVEFKDSGEKRSSPRVSNTLICILKRYHNVYNVKCCCSIEKQRSNRSNDGLTLACYSFCIATEIQNPRSLWRSLLRLHLLICQPTYVLSDYSIFTRSLKIPAGFSSLCAPRSKKKNAADEDSACTFPDVGLFSKAVGVNGGGLCLLLFSLYPARFEFS